MINKEEPTLLKLRVPIQYHLGILIAFEATEICSLVQGVM